MDPGISFHPVYVSSHTQNICAVNIANSRKNDTATPEGKGLGQDRKDAWGQTLVHNMIVLCSFQGVILTTVNTIEILAPLLGNELDIPSRISERPHQIGV